MLAGGLVYIAGALSYHRRRPDPSPAVFGYHEVFHACVCAAATCQHLSITLITARIAGSAGTQLPRDLSSSWLAGRGCHHRPRGRAPPFGRGVLPASAYVRVKLWPLSLSLRLRIRGVTAGFWEQCLYWLPLFSRIEYSAADGRLFGREQDTAGYVGRDQRGCYPDRLS